MLKDIVSSFKDCFNCLQNDKQINNTNNINNYNVQINNISVIETQFDNEEKYFHKKVISNEIAFNNSNHSNIKSKGQSTLRNMNFESINSKSLVIYNDSTGYNKYLGSQKINNNENICNKSNSVVNDDLFKYNNPETENNNDGVFYEIKEAREINALESSLERTINDDEIIKVNKKISNKQGRCLIYDTVNNNDNNNYKDKGPDDCIIKKSMNRKKK